tara:strand:- start:576 stop:719 length:144 start_codon:yes stop_codon:yes gene_type:complete
VGEPKEVVDSSVITKLIIKKVYDDAVMYGKRVSFEDYYEETFKTKEK